MKKIIYLILISCLSAGLLQAQQATADALIKSYLDEISIDPNSVQFEITQDRKDANSGLWKIHALQKIDGIYYRDGILTITIGNYGNRSIVDEFYYGSLIDKSERLSPIEAMQTAFSHLDIPSAKLQVNRSTSKPDKEVIFDRTEQTASESTTRLMYMLNKQRTGLVKTWETQMHTADRQNYWITYVDAESGQVIENEDKVLHCSFGDGLVYDASPEEQKYIDAKHHAMHMDAAHRWDQMKGEDHVESEHAGESMQEMPSMLGPVNAYLVLDAPAEAPNDTLGAVYTQDTVYTAGDPIASPFGWTSTDGVNQNTHTKGNNVWSFYDPSPGPLGGAPNPVTGAQNTSINPITMEQEFLYPWDLSQEPEYSVVSPTNQFPNRNAAIVNLFYWNNLIHDVFYQFGFNEAGLNFQFDNMAKGGVGNDEVLAQAQDGGGTNNANFLTLADGVNGQMQMYLWTSSVLDTLVHITSVSIATSLEAGDGFPAIQGALYNAASPPATVDLVNNPVLNKNYVLVNNGCGSPEGCGAGGGVGLAPCNTVTDRIVLIDRGTCSFVEKVDGAQKGGAAGVIVMNNDAGNPDAVLAMGGTDPTANIITIPAVMVSYNSGLLLKQALADGATVVGSLSQENTPEPKKDGDFDNGIIAHEYGHGITTRTSPQSATGGTLSGSEQGGEGWADFIALYLTTTNSDLATHPDHPNGMLPNKGIGTYVRYDASTGAGIRPRRYSVDETINEYTFTGATNGGFGIGNAAEITIPHGVGFIWCTMLWEMTQNLVDLYGLNDDPYYSPPSTGVLAADTAAIQANNGGNNLALKLILEGISLQPPSPRFVDMRDGILNADTLLYDGAHSCLIWEAFAKRGLGINTVDPTNAIGDEVDGYATPCDPSQVFVDIRKSAISVITNKNQIAYSLEVTNNSYFDNTATDVEVLDVLPADVTFMDASGAPFVESGDSITFTVPSIDKGDTVTLTVLAFVNTPTNAVVTDDYDYESDAQGWTVVTGGSNSFERITGDAANAHGGSAFFFTPNMGLGGANTTLTSPPLDTEVPNKQIRFWHKFHTDAGYDGGFLETTVDGVTWARIPVQDNGYNGALNSTFNPVNAGAAFTGFSAGYIESAASLPDEAIQVRFVFTEDVEFGEEGWWIDDVRIVSNPIIVTNVCFVADSPSSGGRVHSSNASTLVIPPIENHVCEYVTTTLDEGLGSLPFAIGCAADGDTIRFDVSLHMDTIKLQNNQIHMDKSLFLEAASMDSIFVFGESVQETLKILDGQTVYLKGLHIIGGTSLEGSAVLNEGNLTLDDIYIYHHSEGENAAVLVKNEGTINIKGNTVINNE